MQMSLRTVAIATSAFVCAMLLSFEWSERGQISLAVDSVQARVGRPLTPVSVAGVARRQTRRAVYGTAAVGAAAAGTAYYYGTQPRYGSGLSVSPEPISAAKMAGSISASKGAPSGTTADPVSPRKRGEVTEFAHGPI
jgi:hypothetical protein